MINTAAIPKSPTFHARDVTLAMTDQISIPVKAKIAILTAIGGSSTPTITRMTQMILPKTSPY